MKTHTLVIEYLKYFKISNQAIINYVFTFINITFNYTKNLKCFIPYKCIN